MSMEMSSATDRPAIVITEEDFKRLDQLATSGESSHHPVAEILAAELDRAVVCPAEKVAPDVVTMNARVTFHVGADSPRQTRTLVYPEDYPADGSGGYLSVMTPLGAALVGLRAGASVEYETVNGGSQLLTVDAVEHPGETEHRPREKTARR
jgi:regulator of nucleoside diphosphate kinase